MSLDEDIYKLEKVMMEIHDFFTLFISNYCKCFGILFEDLLFKVSVKILSSLGV